MTGRGWKLAALACASLCAGAAPPADGSAAEVEPLSRFVPGFRFRGQARLSGTVGVRAGCIVIVDEGGQHFVPIWSPEVELGRDERGWLVRDTRTGQVLRRGDRAVAGGGVFVEPDGTGWKRAQINAMAEPDVPKRCGPGIRSFHAFERQEEAE